MTGEFMHKNKLQEYAQKFSISLPTYCTVNEGVQHAPQFRATVTVNGSIFKSPSTFSNKKAAEQDAAKYALDCIISNIKTNGVPVIHNDTTFCKSVLHEFAAKMNMKMPTYETSLETGPLPAFASTICFDNKMFKGGIAKSKKEAEQIAARTVIEFILGNSEACTTISQIVKSKDRFYATLGKGNGLPPMPNENALMVAPSISNTKADGMEAQTTVTCNKSYDGIVATTADQSIHPEACKQTSELRNANALTSGEAVTTSLSTSDVSRNDIGAPHLKNPAGNASSYPGVVVPVIEGQNSGSQSRHAVIIKPSIPETSAERKKVQPTLSCQMPHHVQHLESSAEALSNVASFLSVSPGPCNQINAEAATIVTSTSHVSGHNIGVQHTASTSEANVPRASKKRPRRRRKGSSSKKKARGDEPSNPPPATPQSGSLVINA